MKTFLFLLLHSLMIFSLLGCGQQAEENITDKIDFVPNEKYVGDPNPPVIEEMKLTDEERTEFEKLREEIQSRTEVE